ncbi:MAG: hypothetical protein GY866_32905 [Proteobacteria bacterium]|nr:hypothetical protein [Pseudomonadota bacterium]
MFKKSKALVVDDGVRKEMQVFARMSYDNHLALVTEEADKSFKRVYKKADKIVKRKRKEYLKERKPGRFAKTATYVGNYFVIPIAIGTAAGAVAGVLTDVALFFDMVKTATLGDISAVYGMALQGAVSVGVVRAAIEVVKVPWEKLGLGKENHPNKIINTINGVLNFVPRIIKGLAPKEEEESVEDYIGILENNPRSRDFMKDPETKARLYVLYSLRNYKAEKPKVYNYKILHAIKGGAKYAIVGGLLSLVNPLESVFPLRTSMAAFAGALSEFIYKRNEEIVFKNEVKQKNADYKSITKKMDDDTRNRLIGCLVNHWFGGKPADDGTVQ